MNIRGKEETWKRCGGRNGRKEREEIGGQNLWKRRGIEQGMEETKGKKKRGGKGGKKKIRKYGKR